MNDLPKDKIAHTFKERTADQTSEVLLTVSSSLPLGSNISEETFLK
jgi:hypothetical protein